MHADRLAVVGLGALRLLRPQADRATPIEAKEVVNRLASLALDLVNPSPAKRHEKLAIERQTHLKRADHEVQVVEPSHRVVVALRVR
jgi:hypothetical protein